MNAAFVGRIRVRGIRSRLASGAGALLLAMASQAGAATITVTVGTDGPLTVDANCTFREAVLRARAGDPTNYGCGAPSAANDEIRFGAGVTQVNLTQGSIQVDTTIVFTGPVIINGSGNGGARAFSGSGLATDLTFTGITFQNFNATSSGGGVMNIPAGNVTITNSNFNNNQTQGDGGAIYFGGDTLSINGLTDGPVVFADNQAQTSGGAIYVFPATAFLVTGPVQFTSNTAGTNGGAIAIAGVGSLAAVNITAANFTLNKANGNGDGSAYYGGGAIYVNGGGSFLSLILIQECAFELNEAPDGSGGAIFNVGVVSWPDTINDLDDLHAGGIFNCYFLQNKASGGDGANDGLGGAIFNDGRLSVLASTFDGNESASDGGAIANKKSWSVEEDRLRVINSTFSANVAGANGGAIANRASAGALLLQVTMADNEAASGGALHNASVGIDAVKIANSVLATSPSGGNCAGLALDDQGGNVQFPGATCGAGVAVGDPQLQALLPNPPPLTPTMALGTTSAALGIGVPSICNAPPVFGVDQRLAPRPQGGTSCDAGAYESSNPDPQPGYGSNPAPPGPLGITTTEGVLGTVDLVVSETGTATLDVTNIQVLPGTPEISLQTASSFSISDGGPAQTVTVGCLSNTAGPYTATLRVTHNGTFAGSPPSPTDYFVNCTVSPAPEPGYGSNPAAPGPLTITTTTGVPGSTNLLVSETGTATLDVTNIQVLPGTPEISLQTASSFSISDGGPAQTVTVGCLSNTAGPYTATLRVTHNGTFAGSPPSPTDYFVNCTVSPAPEPGYGSNPATPGPLTITTTTGVPGSTNLLVSETGTATLDVTSIQVLPGTPEISLQTASSFSIVDGGPAQTVTVGCLSNTAGPYTATLRVTHNGTFAGSPPSPTDYTVNCTVSSVPEPGYSSNPATPGPLTITTTTGVPGSTNLLVSETGTATLDVTSIQVLPGTPEITLTTASSFSIVDGGPAQTVTVACLSNTAGPYTATLRVTHNGTFAGSPPSPTDYTVNCTVSPVPEPGYSSNPATPGPLTITTTTGVPGSTNLLVSETGTATLDVTNVQVLPGTPEITLTTASSFSIVDGGPAQTVTVACLSNTAGPYTATLRVTHNGTFAGSPPSPTDYTVNCTVNGGPAPGYGSTPNPGQTLTIVTTPGVAGAANLTVFETGNALLDVTSVLVTGSALSLNTAAAFQIADGGANALVTVGCQSATLGVFSGQLQLTHNAAGSPAQYPLTCVVRPLAKPGDFTQDGNIDILFRNQITGENRVWQMNDLNRIADLATNPAVLSDLNWRIQGTNDYNNDGHTDVVWRHAVSGKNVVWFMNQTTRTSGTFTNPDTLPSTGWQIVGTGHFDGDGLPDLLWRNSASGRNTVWLMSGVTRLLGTFTTPDTQAPSWRVGGVADFDGDQDSDILWQDDVTGDLEVWFMAGTVRVDVAAISPQLPPSKVGSWLVQAASDLNNDGWPDLIWRNTNSGRITVWHMNGVNRIDGAFTNPSLQSLDWKIVGPR